MDHMTTHVSKTQPDLAQLSKNISNPLLWPSGQLGKLACDAVVFGDPGVVLGSSLVIQMAQNLRLTEFQVRVQDGLVGVVGFRLVFDRHSA